tara:strand:+ start:5297 stop:5470 length:174 start_codon:yes stop_codon:yes gene_type:complete
MAIVFGGGKIRTGNATPASNGFTKSIEVVGQAISHCGIRESSEFWANAPSALLVPQF